MESTTRDRLIDAAATLLDQGGPANMTLREVGRSVGVSHNAPYRHFADKDDLLAAVAARELRALTFGPEASVHEMLSAYIDWGVARPERFRLTFGRWESHHAELEAAANEARGRMVEAVVRAQDSSELPREDPERMAALLLAAANGAIAMHLDGHLATDGKGGADPKALLEKLLGWLHSAA